MLNVEFVHTTLSSTPLIASARTPLVAHASGTGNMKIKFYACARSAALSLMFRGTTGLILFHRVVRTPHLA